MSDPSDKTRRDAGPLPRTNRPRRDSARRRSARREAGAVGSAATATTDGDRPTREEGIHRDTPPEALEQPPRSARGPASHPDDEALLGERPTQLALEEPISRKIVVSGTLKHASLEMPSQAAPASGRTHGAAYLGSVIDGRYRIDGILGRGGMGVVYRARHEVLDKPFAIKILLPTEDHDVVERFVNEARAATAIGNEHIVDTVDFGQLPDGSTYFVMEYLEGHTLAQRMKSERLVPVSTAISIAKQIAEGMDAAHHAGIVHRDLKPENIFLTRPEATEDFVKLLDFGIAKMQARENKLTRAGTIFGTPHYMSPEQASASEVDTRADIYSLGVILYEMLAGQVPFDAENPMGLLTQHLYTAPVPLTSREDISRRISIDLDAVVLTCLAKQPGDRYASMEDLVEDLSRVERGAPPEALARLLSQGDRKSSDPLIRAVRKRLRSGRSRWWIPVLAGVFAFSGALVTTSRLKQKPSTVPSVAPSSVPVVAMHAEPAPHRPPAPPRQPVALVFSPIDGEVFRNGRSLGHMPVTVHVTKGESVTVEIRRDGFYPEKVRLDGSEPVVVVKLAPIPGVKPSIPVPSGEPLDALRRASAAARAMLADAGAWRAIPVPEPSGPPLAPIVSSTAPVPSVAASAVEPPRPPESTSSATPAVPALPPSSAP